MIMASNEGQDQSSQQSAEDYWLQCIKTWYPELHSRTYFLPPLHFNRVPYRVEYIAGEQVLVPQIPQDGPSQTSPPAKCTESRSQKQECQTKVASRAHISGSMVRRNQGNLLLPPVYDSDVRDDNALERVLYCLRTLADSQPNEVMMVVSQLQFGKYLGEPSYAATADLLPRPSTLPQHFLQQSYHEGDFDVLIIHRQHGLFTLEIKSVGANFSRLEMTEQQKDDAVIRKMKEAVKQLKKAEVVLKHLTSDLADMEHITKILAMPNINTGQLLQALNRNTSDGTKLCQCLGVHSFNDVVKLCLLSDRLSDKQTPSEVNHIVLKDLDVWWQQVVMTSGSQPLMTSTLYERLVARFCGPATTVEVHCVTAPRLDIRVPGAAVSETGERMARLVLLPRQFELLNRSPPRVFLIGPPGTGKTVVLIMQGLTWLKLGHEVHVISTWDASVAATIVIEHQLHETTKTTTAIHRHQFDFENDEVDFAVRRLKSMNEGRQLCVIADEVVNDDRKSFTTFCNQLIAQVPGVYLWGASVHCEVKQSCLEEVRLTVPLRSPPVVVREVKEALEIKDKQVNDYTVSDIPVPTDGPAILRISHSDGCSGHTWAMPLYCVECGQQVARILSNLNVGLPAGNSNGPPTLQNRDVLVLCNGYPTDDRVDSNGQVTTASGLVQGLRNWYVPVRVVEEGDEAAIRDTALGVDDQVTVTNWQDVHGLERKVVVVECGGFEWSGVYLSERLYAMSRCTSQLVLIDF